MHSRRPYVELVSLAALLVNFGCSSAPSASHAASAPKTASPSTTANSGATSGYPKAARGDTVDDYHGTKVADPYRWLENSDSPETRAWIDAENKLTFDYLGAIPERAKIHQRLTELTNYERYPTPPAKHGAHYFFTKNDGLQNQAVIWVTDSLAGEAHVLLDPNTLSKDGTVAIGGSSVSSDGHYFAYGIADGGSDWQVWRVRDVDTGHDLADTIRWVKFNTPAWLKDGSGFFYARFDEPKPGAELQAKNDMEKVFFHKLFSEQSQDVLVYERPDQPKWGFSCTVSDDGAYLVINSAEGTDPKNRVFYKKLDASKPTDGGVAAITPLLVDFDASYDFVGSLGSTFWFLTNYTAPRQRLIAIDTEHPERASWKEIVPEAKETLQGISAVGGRFVASYLKDAHSVVRVFDVAGKFEGEVQLPGLGTAAGFGGEFTDQETFYSYTSFTTPGAIYHYDIAAQKSELFRSPKTAFDPAQFTSEQIFYTSKDGTKVPMFLTYKKGLKRDGKNPTLLYGYGGFNISMTPTFSATRIAWLELGGVYAVANLRGGGEYGEEWHLAGTKVHKQNVFDDFIAAGEWLVREKWTSPKKLAIQGGSNGGLLIGACITQRPDLFGAALPAVGVMDMLRFREFTIGWAWESDYGTVKNPDEFKAIYAYSPLHNIKPGTCYPPTLITTADHDDRVVPAHSFKFAATMQAAQSCANPILIRIETRAGHGAGKPTSKQIDESADQMAFLVRELGM